MQHEELPTAYCKLHNVGFNINYDTQISESIPYRNSSKYLGCTVKSNYCHMQITFYG